MYPRSLKTWTRGTRSPRKGMENHFIQFGRHKIEFLSSHALPPNTLCLCEKREDAVRFIEEAEALAEMGKKRRFEFLS